ncbi:hypothetical protein ACFE04_027603 [Oxalis oulophora]
MEEENEMPKGNPGQQEMLTTSTDQQQQPQHTDDTVVLVSNHQVADETIPQITKQEATTILQLGASTGKYWHSWDKLKAVLSYQLKQVLSEYPESKLTTEQQSTSLDETFPELEKRLNEALLCFDEGPPFTLQRLCEILLAAKTAYPNLSKLALALEKNLLVSSTIPICLDPYTEPKAQIPDEANKASEEETQVQSSSEQDNDQPMLGGDKDNEVIIPETEEAPVNDDMAIDMESLDDIVGSSETNPTTSTTSTS